MMFRWDLPILCGRPEDAGAYYAGQPLASVSPLSCPDNITFDKKGNLWISTDGQTSTFRMNDGVYGVPVEGPDRGLSKQLVSGVPGGETASLCFDDEDTALFVSIQHPGEGSAYGSSTSNFPDGGNPRPSVVVVWKNDGGIVGT
jgi:secreted PhoX family phosphatase